MPVIRVIDLETTGDDPAEHGVVEIGWCDVTLSTHNLVGEPHRWDVGNRHAWILNPGRRIPAETSAVHHLIDDDVRSAPRFHDIVEDVVKSDRREVDEPEIVALAAHSAEFERKFVTDEMTSGLPWICTHKCALRLWPDAPGHSNQTLRYWRRPQGLDRQIATPAHRAGPDAYVTAFHVRDMLEETTLDQLIEWSGQPALLRRCRLGQWRNGGAGTLWEEVDDGFLEWILSKDFDENTAFTARYHLEKRRQDHERESREFNEAYDQRFKEDRATMEFRPPPLDVWFAGKPLPVKENIQKWTPSV